MHLHGKPVNTTGTPVTREATEGQSWSSLLFLCSLGSGTSSPVPFPAALAFPLLPPCPPFFLYFLSYFSVTSKVDFKTQRGPPLALGKAQGTTEKETISSSSPPSFPLSPPPSPPLSPPPHLLLVFLLLLSSLSSSFLLLQIKK